MQIVGTFQFVDFRETFELVRGSGDEGLVKILSQSAKRFGCYSRLNIFRCNNQMKQNGAGGGGGGGGHGKTPCQFGLLPGMLHTKS